MYVGEGGALKCRVPFSITVPKQYRMADPGE